MTKTEQSRRNRRNAYSSAISTLVKKTNKQTNCGYKHSDTTHNVKTFIYELDVSYASTYIFRSKGYLNYNKNLNMKSNTK